MRSNGYNPKTHQHVDFTSLVYRLLNTLLEQTQCMKEYEHELNRAIVDGFDK
jgi:hypothetical protein